MFVPKAANSNPDLLANLKIQIVQLHDRNKRRASSSFRWSFSEEGITQTAAAVFLRSGGPSAAPAQPQSRAPPRGERPGRKQPFSVWGLACLARQATSWGERGPACAAGDVEHVQVNKRVHFSHSCTPIRASVYVCVLFRAHRAPQTLIPEILRRRGAFRPGIQRSSLRPEVEIQIFCRTSKFRFSGCATEAASPSFGGSFPEEGTTQTTAKVFSRSGGPSASLVQP